MAVKRPNEGLEDATVEKVARLNHDHEKEKARLVEAHAEEKVRVIEEARQCCELPGYAIGHVDDDTIDEVIAAGATRIAVCTGIIASPDPRGAARVLHQKLVECASRKVTDGDLR